jgi:ribosome-associated protein
VTGVRVNRSLVIPDDEIELAFERSGGPGGQHSNKVSTRVELRWNVDRSRALGPRQRQRIKHRLGSRIDARGTLRVVVRTHRSQFRNREEARRRLASLVAGALAPRAARLPTQPTEASKERRLQAKRARAEVKRSRRAPSPE